MREKTKRRNSIRSPPHRLTTHLLTAILPRSLEVSVWFPLLARISMPSISHGWCRLCFAFFPPWRHGCVHSSSWYGSCSDCCFFCRHDPHTAMWHDGGCSHGAWRPTCCSHWHAGPSCPHALQTMFAHAVALQECLPLLHMAGGGSGLRTLGGRADMALGDGGCCSEDARFAGLGAGDGLAVEDFFLVDLGLPAGGGAFLEDDCLAAAGVGVGGLGGGGGGWSKNAFIASQPSSQSRSLKSLRDMAAMRLLMARPRLSGSKASLSLSLCRG
jgi:hypothetical protein